MFHMLGLQSLVLGATFLANTVVLLPRRDPREAVRLVGNYGVTNWGAVPTMVMDVLFLPDLEAPELHSLHTISGGGAALPAAVNERLVRDLRIGYIEGWDMTKTASMTLCNPPDHTRPQCLGIPTFGVRARVIDPDTGALLLDGEVGDLVVHGRQVMREYWNNPAATDAAFVSIEALRYLRTGDLVHRDTQGYYFMVDRLKRMINASGYKVWPAEIEGFLHGHLDVQESCVIAGFDGARRGEAVKALVVLRPGAEARLTPEDRIGWARSRLATYKCPRTIEFVDSLPRSATGKLDWRQLQERERSRS